jgi:hypothetical protein
MRMIALTTFGCLLAAASSPTTTGSVGGAAVGATTGAVVGGPIGAVVGGGVGAAAGTATTRTRVAEAPGRCYAQDPTTGGPLYDRRGRPVRVRC